MQAWEHPRAGALQSPEHTVSTLELSLVLKSHRRKNHRNLSEHYAFVIKQWLSIFSKIFRSVFHSGLRAPLRASWDPHLTCGPNFPHGPLCWIRARAFFHIFSLLFIRLSMLLLCESPLSALSVWKHTDAACTAGDWFQLQCITMGLHKKSLLQRDKNLIEFLKAEGWAFWIFPAYAAWRQQIKDGICGDYSQMACNEWLSFPLMVSKQQSKTTVWATFGSDSKLHY